MSQGRIFSRECWNLIRPYWFSKEWKIAWLLLVVIITLNLGEVYLNKLIVEWNNDFYNSLQNVDKAAFYAALIRFSYLAFSFILVAVYRVYLNQMLRIKWRRWMTGHFLNNWLAKQNYYRMQLVGGPTDNPDQRISEDIEQFITSALSLSLGLLSSFVTLYFFLTMLWMLSGPLDFMLGDMPVHIPGYMLWAAVVYAIAGTWLTMKVGRPLIQLNYDQQRFEADFRFSLVRLRENTESIAFYKGEERERGIFMGRFGYVVDNFWAIMKRQKKLNWLNSGYAQLAVIFPFVVAAPRFFAGKIQLGGLMQTASAFAQVQGALSYIVDAYTSIAAWKAVIKRLGGFAESIKQAEAAGVPAAGYERMQAGDAIIANNLKIFLPNGQLLLDRLTLAIKPGDSLLVTGPSGSGKSTLLRTLAGLWPFVEGQLTLPEHARMMFLPQKPYLPLGTLADTLSYPSAAKPDHAQLTELLTLCKLAHLATRLDEEQPWSHILSLGEQQRIAFARILVAKPDFIFLDEATSALDEANEAYLYGLLKSRLPNAAMISVGHRSSLKVWHKAEKSL